MELGLLEAYARDQRRRGLEASTVRRRAYLLRSFAAWLGDDLERVHWATTADVEAWLDTRHVELRTRSWHLSTLSAFYAWLIREDGRCDNPVDRIVRPRLHRGVPRPTDGAVIALALERADARMRAWLALAAFEGLRCLEIARLRSEDVWASRDPPRLIVANGKGRRQRVLPLNLDVEKALCDHGLPRRGWVFRPLGGPHPRDFHISEHTVSKYVSEHFHALGFDETAHALRHFFGTTVYRRSGGDLLLTQQLLGHANPQTTAIYAACDATKAFPIVRSLSAF